MKKGGQNQDEGFAKGDQWPWEGQRPTAQG